MASQGSLEVICGPMFCGKTEELIRRVRRLTIARKRVQVFNHRLDLRYAESQVASHNGMVFAATGVRNAAEIFKKLKPKTQILAIDETQWFGKELVGVVEKLINSGKTVIVSGLSTTYEGKPFEPIPTLMAVADRVSKLSAVCTVCGREAVFHKKVKGKREKDPTRPHKTLVGAQEFYEARCRNHFSTR